MLPSTIWNVRWSQKKARFYEIKPGDSVRSSKTLSFNPQSHPQSAHAGEVPKSRERVQAFIEAMEPKINFPYYFAKVKNQEYAKKPGYETRNDDRFQKNHEAHSSAKGHTGNIHHEDFFLDLGLMSCFDLF